MSNLTERIEEYTPPSDRVDLLVATLRTLAQQDIDLVMAIEQLTTIDDLRGERMKELAARIDRLEDEVAAL